MLYWLECYGFSVIGVLLLVMVALWRMAGSTDGDEWLRAEKRRVVRGIFHKAQPTAVAKEMPVGQPLRDPIADRFFAEGQRLRERVNG